MYVVATVLCRWVRVGENNTPVQKLEVNWNYKCEITVWGAWVSFLLKKQLPIQKTEIASPEVIAVPVNLLAWKPRKKSQSKVQLT